MGDMISRLKARIPIRRRFGTKAEGILASHPRASWRNTHRDVETGIWRNEALNVNGQKMVELLKYHSLGMLLSLHDGPWDKGPGATSL